MQKPSSPALKLVRRERRVDRLVGAPHGEDHGDGVVERVDDDHGDGSDRELVDRHGSSVIECVCV